MNNWLLAKDFRDIKRKIIFIPCITDEYKDDIADADIVLIPAGKLLFVVAKNKTHHKIGRRTTFSKFKQFLEQTNNTIYEF
jgi:hypothetical protein